MKKEQLPHYLIGLAVVIGLLVLAGVPMSSLLFVPLVLACPLMMVFMMRGMGGMSESRKQDSELDGSPSEAVGARDARMAQLEQEVADLRAARDQSGSDRP